MNKVKPQVTFHLAAQPLVLDGYEDPLKTFNTNIIGTANLCSAINDQKSNKSFIVVTSDKCYLNEDKKINFFKESDKLGGHDPYSASKAGTEIILYSYQKSFFDSLKINSATVRAGNVIGGGDVSKYRIFTDIINSILYKKNLIIRNPKAVRPWQHVLEPISGYINLAEKLYTQKNNFFCGAYNFGPNSSSIKTVIDVVKRVKKIKNISFKTKKKNKTKLYESKFLALNIKKSLKKLNWKPKLSLDENISWTVQWHLSKNKKKITQYQIHKYFDL